MYCTKGFTISAEILFLAIVNPNTVNIILNSSPKCLSLFVTFGYLAKVLNFYTPCPTKKSRSIPN